jgi:hypothetical protein
LGLKLFCEAEQRFLLLFPEKEEYNQSKLLDLFSLRELANPQGRLRRVLGTKLFCEAEQRFLLLFPEKEEYNQS